MIIVSACLLGDCCKYNGGHNDCEAVHEAVKGKSVFKVCPEVLGGLPVPRTPAEILHGPVIDKNGNDVTKFFLKGAGEAWEFAQKEAVRLNEPIEAAILKARSPSCGSNQIYDGTFSGNKIVGDGYFAKLLKSHNVPVITELELELNDTIWSQQKKTTDALEV